jgi:hypothetical protein
VAEGPGCGFSRVDQVEKGSSGVRSAPRAERPRVVAQVASGDINPIEIGMLPHSEKRYWASPEGGVGIDALEENVRGYHASVSFLDHQLERLLDSLDKLGLTEDTVILFCVDHGMNIGDHGCVIPALSPR